MVGGCTVLVPLPPAIAEERESREEAARLMRLIGIEEWADTPAGDLPAGIRRLLEIARALATQPSMVLLDEVMGGLNPAESNEMIALILSLKTRGITLVVIEHDMRAIMAVSDRVVVLNSGEMLAEGSPREIANHPEVISAYLGQKVD